MSRSINLTCKSIPGYLIHDDKCLPHSRVSGRAVGISPNSSCYDDTLVSHVNFASLRCGCRHTSYVCHANPIHYRRNPDFTRQKKYGFSRNRNRQHNEEINGHEDLEESEALTSKNAPSFYFSGNKKYQPNATPGHKEKEIVELFRKVQAQLRERTSAVKEERKVDDSQGKNKETETVDSLLKLLRKHSVQQVKKNTDSGSNSDFILDQPKRVDPFSTDESSTSISDSNSNLKHEIQESQRETHLTRPKSNFNKRSPVPEIKDLLAEESSTTISESNGTLKNEMQESERETHLTRPKSNFSKRYPVPEMKFQPIYSEGSDNFVSGGDLDCSGNEDALEIEADVSDEISEDETSGIYRNGHENGEGVNLSGMKMIELRVIAKSHGIKGFSKLKKNELIGLLSGNGIQ